MNEIIKTWNVLYKHPLTNEIVKAVVYAKDIGEARKKAIEYNVPTLKNSFYFEIISIEEKENEKWQNLL